MKNPINKDRFLNILENIAGAGDYDFEEKRKRVLFILFMGVGFVFLLIFGIYHLFKGPVFEGVLCLVLSFIAIFVIFILRYRPIGMGVYKVTLFIYGLFLIFLGTVNDTHGYRVLWLYMYPLMAFYLLGKRDGLVFTIVICCTWIIFLQYTTLLSGNEPYSFIFKIRFIISLLVVAILSFFYEYVRSIYQKEMKHRNSELIHAKSYIENIVENSPIAIQTIGKSGECLFVNRSYCEILEIDKKDILQKNVFQNKSILENTLIEKFNDAFEGASSYTENVKFQCMISNKKILINVSVAPIKNPDGDIDSIIVMFYDNTEKAIAERTVALDLIKARNIQNNIISFNHNDIKDLKINIYFKPMMQVGGDIYDIYEVNEGLYRIFIADATGHGVQAALTTMLIKSEYDKLKVFEISPSIILKIFNTTFLRRYYKLTMFFTCAIIDINLKENKLTYSSAGHPAQYLIRGGLLETLHTKGKMVGLIEDVNYGEINIETNTSSKLILFTDGIYEEFSEKEEEFGDRRLEKIIIDNLNNPLDILLHNIIKEEEKWRGNNPVRDDITLIGIEYPIE
ncbi:MAG: SpoIIE family protein phosphatase [Leptospiraceae bacterium]|nr:SpoIIE family protein phosphatase [Leptospiraceae bacterium]MCP5497068.1 SpoIIE family protein phosphatase [Leptospiraceae bacterium]